MNTLRLKRIGANVVIVTFVVVIAIDALPSTCTAHQRLKDALDPALDVSGLWQEPWRLFAPEPDTINTRLSAVVVFDDGSQEEWKSPDWQDYSSWQRFVHFRHMEYFDKLRMDDHSAAWESFARYLARTVKGDPDKAQRAVRVELTRHWVLIPNPLESQSLMPVGGDWSHSDAWLFYTWTDQP